MSVIRQPGVLGRTTRRRVVGITAALSATLVETVAVGLWFALVVGSRSTSTALAGLGILFCGSLLRAGVFGAIVSEADDLLQPRRIGTALLLTGGWVGWLLAAELVGDGAGVVVAGLLLTAVLTAQFVAERRVFCSQPASSETWTTLVPGLLLAAGASALLVSVWFSEWTVTAPLSLEVATVVVRLEAVHAGILVFALFAFLAHQRRFEHYLEP